MARRRKNGRGGLRALKRRKQLKREKQLALMKELRLFPTKHRVLLPRPEGNVQFVTQPLSQVVVASSTASFDNNIDKSGNDPKAAHVKNIYILENNAILYEIVDPTKLPVEGSNLPIQSATLTEQSRAEETQESLANPAMVSGPGTPVKEIQVKVELPDFLCHEELPQDESDEETRPNHRIPVSYEEKNMSVAEPVLPIKREIASENNVEEKTKFDCLTIKKEELILDEEWIETESHGRASPIYIANLQDNVQKLESTYPREVPLRPGANTDDLLYCDECFRDYNGDCPEHGPLLVVDDTPVTADINDKLRAKKTAPPVVCVSGSGIAEVGGGVWARDVIPSRTRFGPFDGKIVSTEVCTPHTWLIRLNGKPGYCIDAGEPGLSNWIRYVASARNEGEENLRPYQHFGKLYFRTTRQIEPNEELLLDDGTIGKMAFFDSTKERIWKAENDDASSDDELVIGL